MRLFLMVMSRRKKGERNWSSKLIHSKLENCFSHLGIGRKLQDTRQDLALLGEQGKVKGFFNNVKNAEKLSGLVEDIRDAMMDYQVRTSNDLFLRCLKNLLDIITTRYIRQELPTHRESHPTTFRPRGLTDG